MIKQLSVFLLAAAFLGTTANLSAAPPKPGKSPKAAKMVTTKSGLKYQDIVVGKGKSPNNLLQKSRLQRE